MQPTLTKFYELLDDEQKARFNALAEDQRKMASHRDASVAQGSLVQGCGAAQPAATAWPAGEIEARLHPNETQRGALQVLQDTSAEAAETLKAACQASEAMTPPARLVAIGKRLDTMLQATKQVRAALEDFYATLSDEQKAQFEAIGPRRSAYRAQICASSARLLPEYHHRRISRDEDAEAGPPSPDRLVCHAERSGCGFRAIF